MMLPTHVLVGLALAAPLAMLTPDHAPVALSAALAGSVLPDLDLYAGHRRSLHFPTGYALAAVPAVVAAAVVGSTLFVGVAVGLVAATVHCRMDRYGGGLELRPWEATAERAVYDHVRGEWRAPKRWIRYDGAPEDVALAGLVGFPLLFLFDGPFLAVVVLSVSVGLAYGALRRRLATLVPAVAARLPESATPHVPERYRE